jgi:hypothetical protein
MIDYMQEKRIYLIKEVKVEIGDRVITVESLLHEGGLKRVFEQNNLPLGLGDLVGKACMVTFDNMSVKGRVSREVTALGIFFNIKFLDLKEVYRKRLANEIELKGMPPPWKRRYVRINTGRQEEDLPVPFMAVAKGSQFDGIFFNVVNFTLGGILLEAPDDGTFVPRLNQEIFFDLLTNTGDKLESMKGIIMHINEEMTDSGARVITFGTRMMPMNMINEVKYNGVIRDFLTGYKKKMKLR